MKKIWQDPQFETKKFDLDCFNLKYQNLLSAPKAKTTLRRLRIPALVACKSAVLKAVAETANEDTLKTDTVEAITSAAWLQFRALTALDIGLNVMALVCLCLTTYGCRKGTIDAQFAPQSLLLWKACLSPRSSSLCVAHVESSVHLKEERPLKAQDLRAHPQCSSFLRPCSCCFCLRSYALESFDVRLMRVPRMQGRPFSF